MHQLFIFMLILFSFNAFLQSPTEGKQMNLSIDLIHRDSPLSPLYNASATPHELMKKAALRSYSRANFFHSYMEIDSKEYVSALTEHRGEYIIKIYIGNPPVEFFAIADTGSSLVWVKCSSDHKPHHFNLPSSPTYENVSYDSEFCKSMGNISSGDSNTCEYHYRYKDGSFTSGILIKDTFHLNITKDELHPFPEVVFGCSKEDYIHRGDSQFQGIVGLGGGLLSLVSQLKSQIESKFSYCLVPIRSRITNKLRFGVREPISDIKIVSTPLILRDPPRFYYLSLQCISIGEKRTASSQQQGNIMIDSGTALTMLHSSLYNSLEAIVKKRIHGTPIQEPPKEFKLCYETQSINADDLPEMVFHFEDADIHLLSAHTFMRYHTDIICMTIVPTENLSVFGSMVQVNFEVEFDLQNRKVSFAEVDCTKY